MTHIFNLGDKKAYWLTKAKWVELEESPNDTPEIYLLRIKESDDTFMKDGKEYPTDRIPSLLPFNPFDFSDPNNPPEFRASRWIHVIDNPPKENEEVLFGVFDPTTQIFQGYMRNGYIFSDSFEYTFLPIRGIYWQVLPGLPKNIYKDLEEK